VPRTYKNALLRIVSQLISLLYSVSPGQILEQYATGGGEDPKKQENKVEIENLLKRPRAPMRTTALLFDTPIDRC